MPRLATLRDLPQNSGTTVDNSVDTSWTQPELPLEHGGFDGTYRTLIGLIRDAVIEVGHKQVCFDLDISPSQLSHALTGTTRHSFPSHWLLYLIRKSRTGDRIAKLVAGMRAFECVPMRQLSPEEKLAKLKDTLTRKLSPDMQRLIFDDAFGGEK